MSPTKDAIVAGVIKVAFIGSALWFFSKTVGPVLTAGNAETFQASGSSSKVMSEKDAINALTTAKGKFMTVTFLKKDGSTRRMRCRTGVKRYVKGVGSPLGTPSNRLQKYKLITVYDLDKAGYRSIPVDRVLSVKAAGKTFSSKNPKGKQMSAEEYNSYNAEWEAIFDVYGRRGYFADLSEDETDGLSDDEIEDLIMEESDHPEWEEIDEMLLQGIEKHAAEESFAADSGPGILTKEEFDVLMGRVDSMTMNELYMIRHQIHSRLEALGMDFNKYSAESFEAPYGGSGALMDIGKDTALGSFSPSELATSSAIHGTFDEASLNYSGKQNLEVRAESDREEDEEDYEQYLRLQGLCECTACGEVSALSTGTTDKQGLYRCIACVTAKQPSISEEEIVEDMDYLRGTY